MTTEDMAQNALNQCHSKIDQATSVGGLEDNPAYNQTAMCRYLNFSYLV